MLDYKLLEALAMVVQEGGFDRAGRSIHLTQSAVSQRVKLLEEQTGQVLLARANPPRATPAGRRLIKHYLQVKQLEDDLWDATTVKAGRNFATLAIGLNADSLSTWFPVAVRGFLAREAVLLDLRVDDQERTHRLLKDGEVIGCISAKPDPMQGCEVHALGGMDYRLVATPAFVSRWFPRGLTLEDAGLAPMLVFNRSDRLHIHFFQMALGEVPPQIPAHYLPSSEKFVDFITADLGYGMLPDQACSDLLETGRLVDLSPRHWVPVALFWHRWNLKSRLLTQFTSQLVGNARDLLRQAKK